MNIGFFDSGLGGLLVLKATVDALPQYNYVYFGDTANVPYGDRTQENIYELTIKALEFLFRKNCSLVIVACNTVSSEALRKIQDVYLPQHHPDKKVLGVIIPTIETVLALSNDQVTLLATSRTIDSGKYKVEFDKRLFNTEALTLLAAPKLVPLIEAGQIEEAARQVIKKLDATARVGEVVILGCTHYCALKEVLRNVYQNKMVFISQDEVIPIKLSTYLQKHPEIEMTLGHDSSVAVHLSGGETDNYKTIASDLLKGKPINGDD